MKILHITSELDAGGIERLLFDYYRRMFPEIQFDFVVTAKTEGILEKPLLDMGCRVYHIPQIRENLRRHCRELKDIIKNGKYAIVHDHSGYKAYYNMKVAKKCGIKVRIAHSHAAHSPEKKMQKILRKIFTPLTKCYATNLFACGNEAAKWMWGEKSFKRGKVFVMKNAIDAKCFAYSDDKRNQIRKEFGLENNLVIGNVARFSFQKNHEYLLKVFKEVKKIREDAVLMLIGRGELEDDVKKQVEELELQNSVLFMGVRNDVPELLNAMDIFVLPSRFEGLPVTLVEVQANGLPAVVSDTITKEVACSETISFLPLTDSLESWGRALATTSRSSFEGYSFDEAYDIVNAAHMLNSKYRSLVKD